MSTFSRAARKNCLLSVTLKISNLGKRVLGRLCASTLPSSHRIPLNVVSDIDCPFSKQGHFFTRPFSKCIRLAMGDAPLDIKGWRNPYLNVEEPVVLEENLPTRDPFKLFDVWFKKIAEIKATTFEELNTCCFSTVGKNLRPSSRVVLLKAYSADGFSFYTNYNSRKGKELQENPYASMLFYWARQHRQIRIEGKVEKLSTEAAVEYWNSRPLSSRIGSKSSEQSSVIPNRQFLIDKRKALEELAAKEGEAAITKPESWGGYILVPDYFEFWQGQSDRVHDRLTFRKLDDNWVMQRLSP